MYDTLRHSYYWPCMAKDVHMAVAQCAICAQNGSQYNNKGRLQLLHAKKHLEFVGINIPSLLPKTL